MIHPLEEAMKAEFGTMPEFKDWDTAWILSDGSLVPRGRGRTLAHHDMLRELLGVPYCPPNCIQDFMSKTGVIRLTERSSLHLPASRKTLTPRQMRVIKKICESDGCEFYITDASTQDCGEGYGGVREMVEAMERCLVR